MGGRHKLNAPRKRSRPAPVIYINDLPSVVENFPCKLYADEIKIIANLTDESDSDKLQLGLDAIVNWTDKWLSLV